MMISASKSAAIAAAMLLVLPAAAPAFAQSASSTVQIKVDYPKPWPLRHLVKDGVLTIATTGKTAAITFVDDSGNLAGARIDLWNKISDDLGLKPNYVVLDWAGVLPGLSANRFDLACEGASWTNARLGSPDFYMSRPVEVVINVGMVLKDSGIKTWADVAGKHLGGVKGEEEVKDLVAKAGEKADKDVLEVPGVPEARLALLNGQIDVFGVGLTVAQALMAGPDGDKFAVIAEPTMVSPSGFCVNKNEGDLAQAVNVLIAKYRADGTLKAVADKWKIPDEAGRLALIGY